MMNAGATSTILRRWQAEEKLNHTLRYDSSANIHQPRRPTSPTSLQVKQTQYATRENMTETNNPWRRNILTDEEISRHASILQAINLVNRGFSKDKFITVNDGLERHFRATALLQMFTNSRSSKYKFLTTNRTIESHSSAWS